MQIRNHVRTLTLASMLALTILSLPAVQAEAHPKGGTPQPVLCAVTDYSTDPPTIVFAVPGESVSYTLGDGMVHTAICGEHGSFIELAG